MIKLSDIIKSRRGNPKIKRFINRYVLSKKEKKDIINEIKTKGSSSGSSSKYAPRYFSIDFEKADETWIDLFNVNNDTYKVLQPFSTVKIADDGLPLITQYGTVAPITYVKAFSYIPCCIPNYLHEEFNLPYKGIVTFEQCIEIINIIGSGIGIPQITLDGITEITEEEYYKID